MVTSDKFTISLTRSYPGASPVMFDLFKNLKSSKKNIDQDEKF